MAGKAHINVNISSSSKERLLRMTKQYGVSQGDIIEDALKNFYEKQDRTSSAPDLVLDRMNGLTLSVMELTQRMSQIQDTIKQMQEHMEQEG